MVETMNKDAVVSYLATNLDVPEVEVQRRLESTLLTGNKKGKKELLDTMTFEVTPEVVGDEGSSSPAILVAMNTVRLKIKGTSYIGMDQSTNAMVEKRTLQIFPLSRPVLGAQEEPKTNVGVRNRPHSLPDGNVHIKPKQPGSPKNKSD